MVLQSWELNIPGGEISLRELPKQKIAGHGQQSGHMTVEPYGIWFTLAGTLQGRMGVLENEPVKESSGPTIASPK